MKFAKCILTWLVLLFSVPSSRAIIISDARSKSLALADVALTGDAAGWSNPASLAFLETKRFILIAENPWCLPELGAGAFSFCIPVKAGTIALTLSRYGYEAFYESQAGLSFGKSLGKKVKAGINLEYRRIKQYADYGSLYAIIPSLGILVLPISSLGIGLQVSNPAGQGYYPQGYMKFPSVIKAGLSYQPDPAIMFCFQMYSESGYRPEYSGGIEYNLEKQFVFRIGLSSSNRMHYSLGIGYLGKHLRTDIAVSHHPVLGFSPAVTLTFFL